MSWPFFGFSKARSSESRGWLLYVVPICAAGRLLMIPAIWRKKVFALVFMQVVTWIYPKFTKYFEAR